MAASDLDLLKDVCDENNLELNCYNELKSKI